jgi:prepilin-type N-terminal cleavage/methylation domain-containing protein
MPRISRHAFTLIELLVVIAIIAVLAVVVIFVLNPAQLLAQSRDSDRISDMATLNNAVGIYQAQGGSALGLSATVYVSIPDPVATSTSGDQCQGLGMPTLPATYAYHCAASSTFRNIDGTGWIPVNFQSLAAGAPISQLPIDPVNSSSSREYYAYATNGSQYEITSVMESSKYKLGGSNDMVASDGGTLATVYEKGSKFGLEPLDYGDPTLLGDWTLNEGTGSVAYDYSGNNATDTWNGVATGTSGYYSAGKVGPWAGAFDGSSTYANDVGANSNFNLRSAVTMIAWVKLTSASGDTKVISKRPAYVLTVFSNNIPETEIFIGGVSMDTRGVAGGTVLANGTWYQIAGTYDGTTLKTYVNGALDRQLAVSGLMDVTSTVVTLGKTADSMANYFPGLIDDARVYSRALSAAEIQAMYVGGK